MTKYTTTPGGAPPLWFVAGMAILICGFFVAIIYGPVIEEKIQAIRRYVVELRKPSERSEPEDNEPKRFHCRERCGAGPFPKRHDQELHEEAKHGIDHGFGVNKSNTEEKEPETNSTANDRGVRLRDYVDKSETPEWLEELQEEDDDGIVLQEPEGGKDEELEAERLQKCWKPLIRKLEVDGHVNIGKNEHPLGRKGPRGPDAARLFEKQAKRMNLDFEIDVELGKPSTIKTSET